ncbi:MAG: GAF domain-containing protein, partial [Deltaproteobacteria bacterium]
MPFPNLLDSVLRLPVVIENKISLEHCREITKALEEGYVYDLLSSVILESESILALDPRQRRKKILEQAAETIVRALGAEAASIRLLEPKTLRMLNFGSFGLEDAMRAAAVPALDSISGMVAQKKSSVAVPSILQDPLYKNKDIVHLKGYHSLLAVPLLIPSFIAEKNDFIGSLQIYYKEDNRQFNKLEIIRAEMLARRVSYVLAKKKIIDLYVLNQRKEKIADKVFLKLSHHESIKLKDIFNMLIQELGELLQLQGCSLFSVTDDRQHIYLEAAYPVEMSYHSADHLFTISHHPYFHAAVYGDAALGDAEYERTEEQYILIKDPVRSRLTSSGLRHFVSKHNIYSILMIPIRVNDNVRHVLAIYATENKKVFSEDEIELLTFLAKEIMKAAKLEFLGETLHDFKNPAVAVAGLAGRCHRLLERTEDLNTVRDKLTGYLEVIARETERLQDIALTQTGEGREEIIDLGRIAERRYALNNSIILENRMAHITVHRPEIEVGLLVRCPLFSLERVIDNLLHNATKAVPAK